MLYVQKNDVENDNVENDNVYNDNVGNDNVGVKAGESRLQERSLGR